jgi:hypothetical protein
MPCVPKGSKHLVRVHVRVRAAMEGFLQGAGSQEQNSTDNRVQLNTVAGLLVS